jgi:hypothetical protein
MLYRTLLPAAFLLWLFSSGSHAFFPFERPATAVMDVANPVTTAPVERLRRIPEHAKKGVMEPPRGRQVMINDILMVLAPGATIRDMNNRIVLPNTVRRPKKIRYTLDMYGQVRKIWISPTGGFKRASPPVEPPEGPRDESPDDPSDEPPDDSTDESTDESTDSPEA